MESQKQNKDTFIQPNSQEVIPKSENNQNILTQNNAMIMKDKVNKQSFAPVPQKVNNNETSLSKN